MSFLLASFAAFLFALLLVPLVGQMASVRGLYALPSFDRWHRRPVPRLGGIAMLLPVLLVVGLTQSLGPLLSLVVGSTLMFFVGLLDDFVPLKPVTKLALQMMVAALMLRLMPPVDITGNRLLDVALGFAWIVGITNALNLLDNIDGLAAGVSGIAALFFVAVLLVGGGGVAPQPLLYAMGGFVGATGGFLVYNFRPASIFMGDGGSHFLGSFLAGAMLMVGPVMTDRLVPVAAIPVVLLLIPIFDTAFVTLLRPLSGRSAFLGGRDHTSHRLVALGIGEQRAVLVLYVLTGLGGLAALGLMVFPVGLAWGIVGSYVGLLGVVGIYLGHVKVRGGVPVDEAPPLPTEVTTGTRVYEVLLDVLLLTAAYYLAFITRFRDAEFSVFLPNFARSVPLVIGLQIGTLWLTGKYRQVWSVVGASDVIHLVRTAVVGVAISVVAVVYASRLEGYSRLVFAFDAMFSAFFLVGARVTLSAMDEYLRLRRSRGRTVLIFGAGRGGRLVRHELLQNAGLGLTPMAFVDDDPAKRRLSVEGLPVVATLEELPALLDRDAGRVSAVIVSISGLPAERLDYLLGICAPRGVAVQRLRVELEELRRPAQGASVVRFPGA